MIEGNAKFQFEINDTIFSLFQIHGLLEFYPQTPWESMDPRLRTSERKTRVQAGSQLRGNCSIPGERLCVPEEGSSRDGGKEGDGCGKTQ